MNVGIFKRCKRSLQVLFRWTPFVVASKLLNNCFVELRQRHDSRGLPNRALFVGLRRGASCCQPLERCHEVLDWVGSDTGSIRVTLEKGLRAVTRSIKSSTDFHSILNLHSQSTPPDTTVQAATMSSRNGFEVDWISRNGSED